MFSFFGQKKQNEVRDCIQRILNRSKPTRQTVDEHRLEPRYCRSVAVVLVPWDSEPLLEHASYGLVQDMSDFGARIIAQRPILVPHLLCCFAVEGFQLLLGNVRRADPIGGGFWQCGIKFMETIQPKAHLRLDELQSMMDGLLLSPDTPHLQPSA
jgi:hypothetical protein